MTYENAPATRLLATRCACCHRALVDAESVERGVGPDCAKRYGYGLAQGPADLTLAAADLAAGGWSNERITALLATPERDMANALVHAVATATLSRSQLEGAI